MVQMTLTPDYGAPSDNDEGVRLGLSQLSSADWKTWIFEYDKEADTFHILKRGEHPAISYHLPDEPRILLRLDIRTAELVGVECTSLRHYLAKHYQAFRVLYRICRLSRLGRNLPRPVRDRLSWLATYAYAFKQEAEEGVRRTTLSLSHAAT